MFYKRGFTLIELLITIAIISVIAVAVFVAINPLERFKDARNSRRAADLESIVGAVRMYQIENKGSVPVGLDSSWRMLGTAGSGCGIFCGGDVASTESIPGGSGSPSNNDYNYSSQSDFSPGTFSSVVWNSSNSWLELISPNTSGFYTSPVIDSGSASSVWSSFSYVPQFPSGKELPNNGQSEASYPSGNANMSGNILLMHFNESTGATIFQDTSGNSINGTCTGTSCPTTIGTGKLGEAVSFDGVNDTILLPNSASLDPKTSNFTWAGWLKFGAFTGGYRMVYYDGAGLGGKGFGVMLLNTTNIIKFEIYGSTGGRQYSLPATTNYLNEWHYWVFTANASTYQTNIYVDGVLINTKSCANWGSIDSISNHYFASANSSYYNGSMDEVAIYSRVLSAQEILNSYKRGATRLKLQVRSCSNSTCVSDSFIGPDGTNGSYYSEQSNLTINLPSFSLDNVNPNQYFQFKTFFETDKFTYSPELKSLVISSITTGSNDTTTTNTTTFTSSTIGNQLQPACLDLSSLLSGKLSPIPQDPSLGSPERTYYAINRDDTGKLNAQACGAEETVITTGR
ncbi:MAG: LamG-like jellyroll fold domain-containing protein [Candidatus Magasanikiibacteriota bacterium]